MTLAELTSTRGRVLAAILISGCACAVGARLGPAAPAATCLALVPWILVLDAALERTGTLRAALGLAAVEAAVFVVAVFPWFPGAVARYSGASPAVVWALFVLLSPLLAPQLFAFAAARWAAQRATGPRVTGRAGARAVDRATRLRASVAACGAFLAVDALCPKLFFDTLGIGLSPSPLLRQGAALAGVHGLTALALAVNELIAAAARSGILDERDGGGKRRAALPLAAAVVLVGAAAGAGAVRTSNLEARAPERTVLLGAVQANLTAYEKLRAEEGAAGAMAAILGKHIGMSRAILAEGPVDALVWPETVYPTTFGAPKGEGAAVFEEALRDFVRASGIPLVFGAYEADGAREHNAMFFVEPRAPSPGLPEGALPEGPLAVQSYRKRMLFPLTEYVPEAIDGPGLRRMLPWTGRWARGPGARTVQLGLPGSPPVTVLPLLCYDAVVPDHVAEGAALGADMILTLSNDAWFPSEQAAELHLASAALRSVETGLPQVRVTVSGISAVITPSGEVAARSAWETEAKMRVSVPLFARAAPPAQRLAPWLGPIAALTSLALVLFAWRRERSTPSLPDPGAGGAPPPARSAKAPVSPAGAAPGSRERRRNKR